MPKRRWGVVNITALLPGIVPGTRFGYSNTGYNVLGKIIEKASGMSYLLQLYGDPVSGAFTLDQYV